MLLSLLRYAESDESTLGLMIIDGLFQGYTLEDQARDVKVLGETRIPNGFYSVRFREVLTPLTERYRNKFDWFSWHLEICGVPDFQFVYIHIGNDDEDTDGCVLVGDEANNNLVNIGFIGRSAPAYERIYKKISAALGSDEKVFIDIRQANMFLAPPVGFDGEGHE